MSFFSSGHLANWEVWNLSQRMASNVFCRFVLTTIHLKTRPLGCNMLQCYPFFLQRLNVLRIELPRNQTRAQPLKNSIHFGFRAPTPKRRAEEEALRHWMRTTTWLETSNPSNLCGFPGFLSPEILFRGFLKKYLYQIYFEQIWTWMAVTLDILHNPFLEICRGIGVFYHGSSTKTPHILDWHGYSHPTTSYKNWKGKHLELLFVSETKPATYQESFRRAISLWKDHFFKKSSPRMVDSFTHLELAMYPHVNLKIPMEVYPANHPGLLEVSWKYKKNISPSTLRYLSVQAETKKSCKIM